MSTTAVTIAARFNGPPESAHGGYSAGLVGAAIDGPAEVTLLAPPPLERPLELRVDDAGATLLDDGTPIVTGRPAAVDVGAPPRFTREQVRAAMPTREHLRTYHPFPTCYGCGPDREAGDALCLFAGCIDDETNVHGALWSPDGDGPVDEVTIWAALDCPSSSPAQDLSGARPVVLGRFAVDVLAPVPSGGAEHRILSAPLVHDGRKRTNAVWLVDARDEVLAAGWATWIELKPADAAVRRGDGR